MTFLLSILKVMHSVYTVYNKYIKTLGNSLNLHTNSIFYLFFQVANEEHHLEPDDSCILPHVV